MAVATETARTMRPKRFETTASARLREAIVGYAFISIPMLFFILFFLFPIGYAFYISFFDWGILGKQASVGFQNYKDIWHDNLFFIWPPRPLPGGEPSALGNTLYYTVVVVPLQMALGLLLALAVNGRIRGRTSFRAAYYFPSLT